MTLRTGGTIGYSYGTMNCPSLIPSSITRTTTDGSTTYTFALNGTHGTKTTVLDPGKNKTVYTFQGTDSTGLPVAGTPLTLTQVQVYQNTGTVASPAYPSSPNRTLLYCYNNNTSNCATTQAAYPITAKDVYVTPDAKTTSSRTKYTFDTHGNVTEIDRYPFTTVGTGTIDIKTLITYGTWNGSSCVGLGSIVDTPCDVKTTDGGGTKTLSETRYSYASTGFNTKVYQWSGSVWLTTTKNGNGNGTVANLTSPLGQFYSYTYATTASGLGCNSILPTGSSFTLGSATVTTSKTWDCNMGKLLTSTDANNNQSTFTYDLLGRPLSQKDPTTYEVDESYPSATTYTVGDSFATTTTTVDGLGRPIRSQKTDGASYDTVSTAYAFTTGTNPQFQTSFSQPCIAALNADCTKNHFLTTDPLGRSITSSTTSNEIVTNAFNQNDLSVTLSPFPTGEHNKVAQTEYDGLGRVISTCAIQATGGTSCGQVDGNSGILTSIAYSYNSTGTTNVILTRGSQTHQLIYDQLGRLVFQTLPESGSTTYTFDVSSASCGSVSAPGLLVETIDANGVHVCYNHDALGRLTEFQTPTPLTQGGCYDFIYGDQWAGTPLTNANLRLVDAVRDLNCNGGHDVDEIFQYDPDGRMTDLWETTPHSGGQYHTQAGYALNGMLNLISGVPGKSAYTIVADPNGRPDSSKYGTTVVGSNVVYNANGSTKEIDYQSSDKDVYTPDPNTGLMTAWAFTVGATTESATLTWNANRSLKTLAITDGFHSGGTQTCHFNPTDSTGTGYDDVGRLVGMDCGTLWHQTFAYDQYDNFSKTSISGATNWNPTYSATTNHMGNGATYDSDGQVTYDTNNSYAWDPAIHKMITANSGASLGSCGSAGVTCITYDAFGRPAENNVGGAITELLYSPIGLTGIMSGQTTNNLRLPIPGGSLFNSSATNSNIYHFDWLGSARIVSTLSNHTVTADNAYTPYGEKYSSFGTAGFLNFTGDFQDLYSGLYDTPNREFDTSSGSRWLSPDPARASWNAYSYPTNPNSFIDPRGLGDCSWDPNSNTVTCTPDPGPDPGTVNPGDPCSDFHCRGRGPSDPTCGVVPFSNCPGPGGGGGGGHPGRGPSCGVVPLRPCGPGNGAPAANKGPTPCGLSPWERMGLVGSAIVNLNSAFEKIESAAAAGISTPITGSGGVALAVGQTLSAAGSVATGFLQVTAAITDNSGIANASTVASVFTGFSGPITLAASGGNVEAAAMASTLEGFFTFGLSGAVSPVGVGSIADLVSSSADFVAPAQTPAGCQ